MDDRDNILYVCSLVEYIGRKTKNHRAEIVNAMGENGIQYQLDFADVNHCLSFEQVSDEIIEQYGIKEGDFDTVTDCQYTVPSFTDIGKVYRNLVISLQKGKTEAKTIFYVFSSFLSDAISYFDSATYYQNDSYLLACYKAGTMLS